VEEEKELCLYITDLDLCLFIRNAPLGTEFRAVRVDPDHYRIWFRAKVLYMDEKVMVFKVKDEEFALSLREPFLLNLGGKAEEE
jgi:hypothetical protein